MKERRQAKILELISQQHVETQEQLLAALQELGFRTTQSTISRDIKELGLVKSPVGDGRLAYTQMEGQAGNSLTDRMVRTLRNALLSIDYSGNFMILKTFSGGAHAAAAALDKLAYPEVMGTIAGDDTILIILKDAARAEAVAMRLRQLMTK
ncbi:MAG: arginine repressor [Bacillota bacterium]|jgi:transcriptional regulator of arginine metabolism